MDLLSRINKLNLNLKSIGTVSRVSIQVLYLSNTNTLNLYKHSGIMDTNLAVLLTFGAMPTINVPLTHTHYTL